MRQINQNILKIKDPSTGEFKTIPNLMVDNSDPNVYVDDVVNIADVAKSNDYNDLDNLPDLLVIDDAAISAEDTWSSQKISGEIEGCYSENNQPPYPVTSVNGKMGVVNTFSMTLLWENESTTTDFTAQTVSIDLSEYDGICIVHRTHKNETDAAKLRAVDFCFERNELYVLRCLFECFGGRYFKFTDDGVIFENGFTISTYGSSTRTSTTAYAIPAKIYGVKFGN